MKNNSFNMDEFISQEKKLEDEETVVEAEAEESEVEEDAPELDIQKAVVEELAAEKVELHEQIAHKDAEIASLREKCENTQREIDEKNAQIDKEKGKLDELTLLIEKQELEIKRISAELDNRIFKELDQQERNPNALALLDRDVEIPDRFPGESRDHVLEVIKEAREAAERDGRIRRAQILESVLVANEPNGTLAKKRAEMEKLFADNANILSGSVIEELKKRGISHKNGEEYLLPSEIIKRNF